MKLHYIANQHVAPASGDEIPVIDPSTGEQFDAIARGNAADIDRAVSAAREAFNGAWGKLTATERGRLLQRLAQRGVLRLGTVKQDVDHFEADTLLVQRGQQLGHALAGPRPGAEGLYAFLVDVDHHHTLLLCSAVGQ